MASDEIEGRVAKVLSRSEVVINRGSTHGVIQGMKFAILDEESLPIEDPDSGNVIGCMPIAKTVVKVVSVSDAWAKCKTFRTKVSPSILGSFAPGAERRETFSTDDLSQTDLLPSNAPSVSIGDSVVEYSGEFRGIVRDFV